MDKVVQTFEGLIRRSVAPSVTFFVLLAAGELIAVELGRILGGGERSAAGAVASWVGFLAEQTADAGALFGLGILLVVLGLSYGLSTMQLVFFDYRLKSNFEPDLAGRSPGHRLVELAMLRWNLGSIRSETRSLRDLRKRVVDRLRSHASLQRFRGVEEWTDYLLYEILGGIDPTDTRRFVDTAKSSGVVALSSMVVLGWNLASRGASLPWWGWLLLLYLIVLAFWWGRAANLSQYRMRAVRLYVNFLMMPDERLERLLVRPHETAE